MTFARVLIVFLLGVGVTLGLYLAGTGQRVPEWWSLYWNSPAPEVLLPSTPVALQTTAPGAFGTAEQRQSGAPPGAGYPGYPGVQNGAPPGAGYPGHTGGQNAGPPADYPGGIATGGSPIVSDGAAPLRLTIVPSRQGFEATCTIYAVVNRSHRPVVLAVAEAGQHNGSGILVRPGETIADETMPEECATFRSLFAGHRVPVGGAVVGAPSPPAPPGAVGDPTWGEPFVKIEITDCAFGECGVVRY